MAAKPTIVIVHGAWHRPLHFDPLTKALESHGYRVVRPALPSVAKAPQETLPDNSEDIALVRSTILHELDTAGHDVILVPHSYGGIPTSSALEGLGTKSRAATGKPTSVLAVAAIASFILPRGMTIPQVENRTRPPGPDMAGPPPTEFFFQDVAPETRSWAEANLSEMSMLALYESPCRFSAWDEVPVFYLLCADDRALPPATQERIVQRIKDDGGSVTTEVLAGSSHSPFLSRVDETAAFVRRSAGEEGT